MLDRTKDKHHITDPCNKQTNKQKRMNKFSNTFTKIHQYLSAISLLQNINLRKTETITDKRFYTARDFL